MSRPFYGDQCVALTLTTTSWLDGLIEIPEDIWIRGGTQDNSRIASWGVQSIDRADSDVWQGRLDTELVDTAVTALVDELR